ncbi:MAG: hypothetical protein AAFY55_14825 [Bacteroidota bacterium]
MLARFLFGGVLLCTLTAFASAPSTAELSSEPTASVTIVKSTHTVRVEYLSRSGALRRARVTITPVERGARAEWTRDLEAVFFTAPRSTPGLSRYSLADRLITAEGGEFPFVGEGLVPAPEYLREFLVRSRGTTHGFLMPLSGTDDPPADDPPKGDPPADDPPEDDDDCSCAGCMEICDPWTCECSDPDPFPETEGFESDGRMVLFGI